MANHRLSNTNQAKKQLQQLRQFCREPRWSQDTELRSFLQEAEVLVRRQLGSRFSDNWNSGLVPGSPLR